MRRGDCSLVSLSLHNIDSLIWLFILLMLYIIVLRVHALYLVALYNIYFKLIFSIFSCGGTDPLGNQDDTTKRRTPRYVPFFYLLLFISLFFSSSDFNEILGSVCHAGEEGEMDRCIEILSTGIWGK